MPRTIDAYTVVIRPDDNGTFVAYVPAIDGCHAWGQSADEARAELANVFKMIADEHDRSGRPLPPDVELTITRAG
jgi:predicted RNase H-like HicB family nuclease